MRWINFGKTLVCTAALALAFGLLCFPAQALTLSDVDGTWGNTIGAGSTLLYKDNVAVAYGNGSENQVLWGKPASVYKSGLGFTGVETSLTIEIGETFEIGQLRHFNNPIYTSAPIATSTQLSISLSFNDLAISHIFDFTFGINETTNIATPAADPANDDIISVNFSTTSTPLDIDGTLYTLELLGFGATSSEIMAQFNSTEGRINSTLLWGVITSPVAPVPEPSTFLLLGAGLIGFGVARKRMKK